MIVQETEPRRLQQTRELLAKHRCRAVRRGKGWHVGVPGVDLLIADLGRLTKADLAPVREPAP
jgi:hypothetical protein